MLQKGNISCTTRSSSQTLLSTVGRLFLLSHLKPEKLWICFTSLYSFLSCKKYVRSIRSDSAIELTMAQWFWQLWAVFATPLDWTSIPARHVAAAAQANECLVCRPSAQSANRVSRTAESQAVFHTAWACQGIRDLGYGECRDSEEEGGNRKQVAYLCCFLRHLHRKKICPLTLELQEYHASSIFCPQTIPDLVKKWGWHRNCWHGEVETILIDNYLINSVTVGSNPTHFVLSLLTSANQVCKHYPTLTWCSLT